MHIAELCGCEQNGASRKAEVSSAATERVGLAFEITWRDSRSLRGAAGVISHNGGYKGEPHPRYRSNSNSRNGKLPLYPLPLYPGLAFGTGVVAKHGGCELASEQSAAPRQLLLAPVYAVHALEVQMAKILLVRHGHVEGIKPERFRGRKELSLTERGRAQAGAAAQRIASSWHPTMVYTSPLGRCIATGDAIARECDVPAAICDDLNDIDYGAWQFRAYAEKQNEDPKLFAAWFATPHLVRFPKGESLQDLVSRSANALRLILARHPGDTVVLVSHDSFNRALLLQLIEQPLSLYWRLAQDPCCINEVDVAEGQVRVLRINDTAHLAASGG